MFKWNKIKLHNKILIGLILGILFGLIFQAKPGNEKSVSIPIYLKPIGIIFIKLLSFIAIPLVISSLFVGSASLGDIKKIARIGMKTIIYFTVTTAIAIIIGLALANFIKPGYRLTPESKERLVKQYSANLKTIKEKAIKLNFSDFLLNLIPSNIFDALSRGNMLQIIFASIFLGILSTLINKEKSAILLNFFDSFTEILIKAVDVIMKLAPYAVFILIAAVISEFGYGIIKTLIWYVITVILGLIIFLVIVYSALLKIFTKMPIKKFFKGIREAQLVAFSTSSSAATLPINMECCQKNLGVPKEIVSFVLPLGATINMNGTALYQGVSALFISQIYMQGLTIWDQLIIILTATLAAIGTAPIPGLGLIMLIIILKAVNIPEEGISLILGVDRILDMCRTVPNITGDALVSVIIAESENKKNKN